MNIVNITGREILDSRGTPTVEVDVTLKNGVTGRASVPSGTSTGSHEALELRDGEQTRFYGKGVQKAIRNIAEQIAPLLMGVSVFQQREIDKAMIDLDGTKEKSRLGANAILGVSLAVAKAAAQSLQIPLYRYIGGVNAHIMPVPMMNVINGGAHSDAPIAFQEFMIRPVGADSLHHALQMGAEVFQQLKKLIKERGLSTSVGDEGGFAPAFGSIEEVLHCLTDAIDAAGYVPYRHITLGLDCAATEYYSKGIYDYSRFEPQGKKRTTEEQVTYLERLTWDFPIDSIEDGMAEEDWKGWALLTSRLGKRCQLVGDDLFVTNHLFLEKGIREHCANSILIKPNQIGTLTETIDAVTMAHRNRYTSVISHRSGETEDTTIADLAVALNAGQIKSGSMSRTDRLAKYNQLLRIEQELGEQAAYGSRYIIR